MPHRCCQDFSRTELLRSAASATGAAAGTAARLPENEYRRLARFRSQLGVPAAAFTAYDPRFDPEGRVPAIAAGLAHVLASEQVPS